ncbi:MAG TPA: N-acetylmuramic acid 6-phosphate etherase [Thermodesulfovibrionales bacterium]|nr:N-acetylmuramic acid 6-phosphate etherase [Thermodesulfovibrionales bacterium]
MSTTEERNPKSGNIDVLAVERVLELMNEEDAAVIHAVRAAIPSLAKAVEEAVSAIRRGGRIFYVGAGTSGRIGLIDAAEMPPTFGVSHDLFRAVIAGGDASIRKSVEGAEDDVDAGRDSAFSVTSKDMVIGISASGRAPFVLAFLDTARKRGARTWLMTCNRTEMPLFLDDSTMVMPDGIVEVVTGPEVIAGSTRLKAGTAAKLVLNMFSSATMIRIGKVYRGLMVDVVPSNKKLVQRAEGIIMEITGCTREEAGRYLRLAEMRPKVAIVMKARGVSKEEAWDLLRNSGDSLREILG